VQQDAELEQGGIATAHLSQPDDLGWAVVRIDYDLVGRKRPVTGVEQQVCGRLVGSTQPGDIGARLVNRDAARRDAQTRQRSNQVVAQPAIRLGYVNRDALHGQRDRPAQHVLVQQQRAAARSTFDYVNFAASATLEIDDRGQAVMQPQADYDRRPRGHPEPRPGLLQQRFVRGKRLARGRVANRGAHDSLSGVTWRGSRISVVLPTYNERDSIRAAILDFASLGVVDELLVINNNAAPGTSEQVAAAIDHVPEDMLVREIHEPRQGYGFAIQRGLREAAGDYIVVSEPDGTFLGRDTFKLLAYVEDFDVVYGSRTARMFIWRGANMGLVLRWGNWGVAKMIEFLFNSTNLTDVGCTMRLIRREALNKLDGEFTVGGSEFGPEMMLLSLLHGLRVIQVPVNYLPRIGVSSVTGDMRKALLLGVSMIGLVMRYRFRAR
jgi:hypothetical protein